MQIIRALDVHHKQITYKWLDTESGEVKRGHITPVTREEVRGWLSRFQERDAHFALGATTGWRFIVEGIHAVGFTPHLAEPAETRTRYGRKRRAKTDHADCDHILDLMLANRLPGSWIPPHHLLELRTRVRLRKALVDQRREWQQRLQAQLFHQGVPRGIRITTVSGRATLADAVLSPAGRVGPIVSTAISPGKALKYCVGPSSRRPNALPGVARQTTTTISRPDSGSVTTAPAYRSPANSAAAPTTSCVSSARRRWRPLMTFPFEQAA